MTRLGRLPETTGPQGSLRDMTRSRWILVLLYVAALAQLAWVTPRMPERMATHYDGAGHPNGWMTRAGMVEFHLAMLAVTAAAFAGLPALLVRLPAALINIPNREYWLSPERRAGTLLALRGWMEGFGCGAVVLLMAVCHLNYLANQESPARLSLPALVAALIAFVLYAIGATVGLYRRFPRPA